MIDTFFPLYCLHQNQTDFVCLHRRALPVVNIVSKKAVTTAKFEIFDELLVVQNIQCVENVEALLFSRNQDVVHKRFERQLALEWFAFPA